MNSIRKSNCVNRFIRDVPGELLDLDVFGFRLELEPLFFLSSCFFSGDSDSVLTQTRIALSERFATVVLPLAVTFLASTLPEASFFWFSAAFTDVSATESGFAFDIDDVRATDALEVVAFIADCADDTDDAGGVDDDGALLQMRNDMS